MHYYNNTGRNNEMGGVCAWAGQNRNPHNVSEGKPDTKTVLNLGGSIKTDLKHNMCKGTDWFLLAHDGNKLWVY
jgi:hypothetical protein